MVADEAQIVLSFNYLEDAGGTSVQRDVMEVADMTVTEELMPIIGSSVPAPKIEAKKKDRKAMVRKCVCERIHLFLCMYIHT